MQDLQSLLSETGARHEHLCPRQVLGVRLGLAGPALVGLAGPRVGKVLWAIAETDGCFADGLEVAAGVSIGHRTLRFMDYGKVAVTFVNAKTGIAVRLAPRLDVRERARAYAPGELRHYYAQLEGYQRMPDEELFSRNRISRLSRYPQYSISFMGRSRSEFKEQKVMQKSLKNKAQNAFGVNHSTCASLLSE